MNLSIILVVARSQQHHSLVVHHEVQLVQRQSDHTVSSVKPMALNSYHWMYFPFLL
jgi:hypothetical protein